ncbi:serine hydrolase domain-containing protein [Thalassotalea fonticola]|uniref:Serine hydrolase domain-containing protein n=1 Tax=Thalassotalea fonticola TaxID=3065649 RepID=A0ABZ0GT42_9GAMM|nr:serine hydrolase domain-containing protein [Colwelliaceae bacterium S1-1]
MKLQSSVIFFLLFILIGCNSNKREDTPTHPFKNIQEVSKSLSQELLQEYQSGTFEGSVLITHRGSILLKESYGQADRNRNLKNTSTSISDMGSIAKSFTAAAILQLVARDKIKLDDTIGLFFSKVPIDKQHITIKQLLSHSSGMDNFHNDSDFDVMSKDEAIRIILTMPLIAAPNEKVAYSNAAYTLLAAIVEKRTNQSFLTYIEQNILTPLSLSSTGFYGDKRILNARLTRGYGGEDSGSTTFEKGLTWALTGAGGMVSSTEDLNLWFLALLDGELFPSGFNNLTLLTVNNKWKLGNLRHFKSWGADILYVGGSTAYGYTAAMLNLPEYDINIILMLNAYGDKYDNATHQKLNKNHIVPILLKGASVLKLPNKQINQDK